MSRARQNTGFVCEHCGRVVLPLTNGSYRNHCPFCLHSKHVDILPGDRSQSCGGLMEPVELRFRAGKGYQIVHRCLMCGAERVNVAATDTEQPDDWDLLTKLTQNVVK